MKYKKSKRIRGILSNTLSCNKAINDIAQNNLSLKNQNETILKPLFSEKFELINYIDSASSPKRFYHNNILHIKKVEDISQFLKQEKYINLDNFSKSVLKKKKFSESCICFFAHQILNALDYMNRCNIIHLDIKPENILIDSNLNIKLIDFPISCPYSEFNPEKKKFPFVGTGKYMSPEIFNGTSMEIKNAQKVHIYSLGVILYCLAFGSYPYNLNDVDSKDYSKIIENIESQNLEFPKDIKISEKFKDFLRKILDKNYQKRLTIKDALNNPWTKGWSIIDDEKENIDCQENFLSILINGRIPKFNEYINN